MRATSVILALAGLLASSPLAAGPGGRCLVGREPDRPGLPERYRSYLVLPTPELAGLRVQEARALVEPSMGQPQVSVTLDPAGARAFEAYTAAHDRERLAIVLDGEVLSAPIIQGAIQGGRLLISLGGLSGFEEALTEARRIAELARAGRLEFLGVDDRTEVVTPGLALPRGIQAAWDGLSGEDGVAHARHFAAEGPGARRRLRDFLASHCPRQHPDPQAD